MLAIIVGGTSGERLGARREFAGTGSVVEEIDDSVGADEIAGMAGSMTLMGDTKVFLLRRVLSPKRGGAKASAGSGSDDEDGADGGSEDAGAAGAGSSAGTGDKSGGVADLAEGLAQSPHMFIFEEDTLTAKLQQKLEKVGAKLRVFVKEKKAEALNMFALGDALGHGDRKTLWLLLMQAREAGVPPEQICGILAWKARTLLAGSRLPQDRVKYGTLSRDLVALYHDSHRGAGDLWLLLERFALVAR